eukprot:10514301-Ditylum_brightwellii.AAC.1
MLFELGNLVYAKVDTDCGYHQARIEMVIGNGRQYFVSSINWVVPAMRDTMVSRPHVRGFILCPVNICDKANSNMFALGDLVYARHCFDGGYHQVRIEMVTNNGRHYFVSWVNPVDLSMVDIVMHRHHIMGYFPHPTIRYERANPNPIGGQDEADRDVRPGGC